MYAPIPRVVPGTYHLDLIRRLLRPTLPAGTQRIDLITTTSLHVSVFDSGFEPAPMRAAGDTVVHILWQGNETGAWIDIDGRQPISPGDTVVVAAGDEWSLSSHQLVVTVATPARRLALPIPPHHGLEVYAGHNRRTTYDVGTIERWKLTEPLTLVADDRDLILLSLYNDLALQHRSGVDLMPQGEVRVVRAGGGNVTIVPNGLSYVMRIVAD